MTDDPRPVDPTTQRPGRFGPFGGRYVPEALIPALEQLTGGKKDTTVFFRADKTVDYETMMKVMDTLHQAGYLKIGLVGEEKAAKK